MKRGNAGASLRESINRTRKFVYDQRNPVRWEAGEREALIQQAIERGMVRKVPPSSPVWQTFFHKDTSTGWKHADFGKA